MPTPIANQLNYALPDPIGVDQLKRRNAFAERDQVLQEQNAQGYQNQLAMQQQGQQRNWMAQDQESKQKAFEQIGVLAQQALQAGPNAKQFVSQALQNPAYAQVFQSAGVNPGQIDLNSPTFEQDLQSWASLGPQADPNIAAREKYQSEQQQALFGQQKELAGIQHKYRLGEIGAQAQNKPQRAFRTLSPDEVTQAGLPPGTAAQQDDNTGQINVLSKRDATGGLSQKDATTARTKLNTVKLARQQLNNIRQRFQGLKGSMSAGPFGQGNLPTEKGQSFDRSVDQMRSTLTALTRTPGVGAMSDYETKLDQSKFPSRKDYESVTQQQIDDLDGMLNAIESGYGDMMSGGNTSAPASKAAPASAQGTQPRQVRSVQEAMALSPGTPFITPDGRRKVR